MKNTCCIVGSHSRNRDKAPWHNADTTDFWVFNESASIGWPKVVNAVFQMHSDPVWKNPLNRNDPHYHKWMGKEHPYPIYMLRKHPDVPSSIEYPLDEICIALLPAFFKGSNLSRYFTSSVAYALALAIYKGYERIELYGVEMESETEYRYQRDGVFFWLGIAVGRGVEVSIPGEAGLFSEPLYGYEGGAYAERVHLLPRLTVLRETMPKAQRVLDEVNALQASLIERILDDTGGEPSMAAVETTRLYWKTVKQQSQAVYDLGMLAGAEEEVLRYLRKCDEMDKVSGFHMLARQEFELTANNAGRHLEQRKGQLAVLATEARAAWAKLDEAIKDGTANEAEASRLSMAYGEAHKRFLAVNNEIGRLNGIVAENITLANVVDNLMKAAGGEKALDAILQQAEANRNGKVTSRGKRRKAVQVG